MRKWNPRRGVRLIAALAAVAIVATAAPAQAEVQPDFGAPLPDAGAKVEPGLASELDSGTTDFWVRFTERADLSDASGIDDWHQRGAAVAAALRATADQSQQQVREQLDTAGVDYQPFWATNAIFVRDGSSDLAAQLAAQPAVDSLHTTTTYEVPELDARQPVQALADTVEWNIADINADQVWDQYGIRGEGITVANIDTGVQYDHPALVGQYRGNLGDGTFSHDYHWFDAAGLCPLAPCDRNGHGTHTMGTMVGDDGGTNRIGAAPDVTWIAANGCCPTDEALITSGQWLLEPTDLAGENPDAGMRPHIINNSWGSTVPSNDPFMEDIATAWAASGIFGVWSNGNSGPACQTSGAPGSRIINYSVGAYDADHAIAGFSSRGTGQDGAVKPDIAAPGVDVRSALPNNRYGVGDGTSMAAPHVAAAAALLWSAAPALLGDVAATRDLLDSTAIDTEDLQCGGTAERNNVFGEGRLDALALLDAAPVEDTGTLHVEVIDAGNGDPVAGARVSASGPVDRQRVTGEDGVASVALPPGDYTVDMRAFGYPDGTAQVTIAGNETTAHTFEMAALDTVTVRGRVTDGSGQGWPLYAGLTIDGDPAGTVHTDPASGRYELTMPAGETHTLTVEALYDGYQQVTEQLEVPHHTLQHDITVPVDGEGCLDIGYRHAFDGLVEGFDDETLPDGWTVVDHSDTGHGWRFDDPSNRGNLTGGEGGFAITHRESGVVGELDASLVTPLTDLTGHDDPILTFRQDFWRLFAIGRVELSIDGGDTWQTLREQATNLRGPRHEVIPIPQAAGHEQVRVRFRMAGQTLVSRFWQIDDVFIGTRTCEPQRGGLVVGHVTDRNTGEPVNGATVRSDDGAASAVSASTAADPAQADGFYAMFSPFDGPRRFTATAEHYQHTSSRAVGDSRLTKLDFRLPAGQVTVEPAAVTVPAAEGGTATGTFTVTNTGTADAQVELRERDSAYPIPRAGADATAATGAEVVRVPGEFSPLAGGDTALSPEAVGMTPHQSGQSAWLDLPDYPTRVMDNAVGELDGRIYSAGGMVDGEQLASGYVYDPAERQWSPIADLPARVQAGAGAVIDGKFYVAGGWEPLTQGTRTMRIYDPETDSWSTGADAPFIFAGAGRAVLDDQLYVVGGCTNNCTLDRVHRYDPATDSWEELARYPQLSAHLACAGIAGQVICAGGTRAGGVVWNHTYAYDPDTDSWTRMADLPIQLWGMSYTASSDRLLVSGGVTGGATGLGQPTQPTELTNEGFIYDPHTDSWTTLPASNQHTYRAGNTCGLTKVGGTMIVGFAPVTTAELLPTFGDCVPADVPWLSLSTATVTLAPGEQVTVTVTVDAAGAAVGDHDAGVWVVQDTPYLTYPVDVTMRVTPDEVEVH